jgi:1,4-dihydroxy-2-naphthoate octaprenyltransferase
MCYEGINAFGISGVLKTDILIPAALTSIMLLGNYPMTQIYQHEEDSKRGDKTLSILLGINGTFVFTAIVFAFATLGFVFYFVFFFKVKYALVFLASLAPVLLYFFVWFIQARNNIEVVNYSRTMWLNFISAVCLNGFFIYFFLDFSQVLQAVKAGF